MFDVDGTLVMSQAFDGDCYQAAVFEVLGQPLDTDWQRYHHVSDAGILDQHIDENGLEDDREIIAADVKRVFMRYIAEQLARHPVQPVSGADEFIQRLRGIDAINLSIATGGWGETALMKLASARIDISGIVLASSNDHHSRIEIMKIAERRSLTKSTLPCTYFGDGEWDRRACAQLGFNFVMVGADADHHQRIADFDDARLALSFLGLS